MDYLHGEMLGSSEIKTVKEQKNLCHLMPHKNVLCVCL